MNKNVFKVLFLTVVGFSTFQENLYGGIKTISNMKIRASKPVSPYSNQIRIQNTLKKRKIELKQMISDTLEKDDAENKAKEYNKLYLSIRNNVDSFNKANRSFLEDLNSNEFLLDDWNSKVYCYVIKILSDISQVESLDKECQNKNTVFFHHLNVLFPFMDHLKSTIKKVEEFSDKVLGWQEADIKSYYDLLLGWIL